MAEGWDYDAHIKEQGGIKHKDKGKYGYSHIDKKHWEKIFSTPSILGVRDMVGHARPVMGRSLEDIYTLLKKK